MSDTAAVLVTYQSAGVIGSAVDSCLAAGLEVVVVDNASSDSTREVVSRRPVQLLANEENLGFAGGVNQGIRATARPFVLLLNPDATLSGNIEALETACRAGGVGAAAGKLVDASGVFQTGFSVRRFPTPTALVLEVLGINRLWPRNPVNVRYRCLDLSPDQAADVEQPAGAFLLIRREAWEAVEGMDERFHPVWFEDVDFCKRLVDGGWKIRYEPSCTAIHQGGHSAEQLDDRSKAMYWYGSLLEYAAKHYPRRARVSLSVAVALGGFLRLITGIVQHSSLGPIGIYANVIRLACRAMLYGDGGEKLKAAGKKNKPG